MRWGVNILVASETGVIYPIAAMFARAGCNVAYYCEIRDVTEDAVDSADVVHVSAWRPHLADADIVVTDSSMLHYKYTQAGGRAPVLFHSIGTNGEAAARLVPPSALAFLSTLLAGEPIQPSRRRWWHRA